MPDTQHAEDSTIDEPVKRLSPLRRNRGPKKPKKPSHASLGDPCAKCGKWASEHAGGRIAHIIGLDGEGRGRFPHRYTLLAAHSETGESWHTEGHALSPEQCFEFLLSLPEAVIVAFSFGYDITKIVTGLSDKKIHKLLHPEERRYTVNGKVRYRLVKYKGYGLNYMNGKLSVHRLSEEGRIVQSVHVWDIWRFFQSRFTKALLDWGIATEEQLAFMMSMKDKRGSFDEEDPADVLRYCLEECKDLALLFRELLKAHLDAGLVLKSYFGAGSTSSALLEKMGIRELNRVGPKEANYAVASAFSAGWFEDSMVGPVNGPLWDADISSAYPYHASQLPCLDHGNWNHVDSPVDSDIQGATLALVHWSLPHVEPVGQWAPFPVRTKDGAIIHPWSAVGGWVWGREFLNGKRICSQAHASEAWLYHTNCDCRPFRDLPTYYLERIRVGKTSGRGKVFKLGPNGVYGKLAQTVGHNPPFQCFIWAGVITSNTRAQVSELIWLNPGAIVSIATDGALATRRLLLPAPVDTGTFDLEEPLGGWIQKEEGGRFLCRPGISFPLEGKAKTKARGYGIKNIDDQRDCILQAWKHEHEWCVIDDGEQFHGAQQSISKSHLGYTRSENYGEWVQSYTVMSFDPAPKRRRIEGTQKLGLLTHWAEESLPYAEALLG